MNRVIFFIDGFNLYHALNDSPNLRKYKWLDISKLVRCYVTQKETIKQIYWFTALATWSPAKMSRHKIYIKALEIKKINIVYGEFKKKDKICRLCNKQYQTYEEKQTDVNIAIHLFQLAIQDKFDKAIIISGDSDLIPAIRAVRNTFPSKSIGVIIPIGRRAESLKQNSDFHMKMKEKHLKSSLLNEEIALGNSKKLVCPPNWK